MKDGLSLLPLFTQVRGRGIPRTSPVRNSQKLRQVLYLTILTLLRNAEGLTNTLLDKGGSVYEAHTGGADYGVGYGGDDADRDGPGNG